MLQTTIIPAKISSLQWKLMNLLIEDIPQILTTTNKGLYHDLAKWLSHYLYFFSFGLTTQERVQEKVTSQVLHSHSHMKIRSHII